MDPEHPNEESLLDSGPLEEERHGIEDFVADGMEDEANVDDPIESEAADDAAVRAANATQLG